MKRKTQKFIESQNRKAGSILDRINLKTVMMVGIVLVVALVLGGLYMWYIRTFGGARKIKLYEEKRVTYEWLQITSGKGITGDYVMSRTNELMISGGSNGTMVPSWYMIEGRLATEEAEESGDYNLGDQALLLEIYVRQNDRIKANKLKNTVLSHINLDSCELNDRMLWLEAYLEYYSAYGTRKDLKTIEDIVEDTFDSDGLISPVTLRYMSYFGEDTTSLEQIGGTNAGMNNDDNGTTVEFSGVPLSAIRLRLIKSLEDNDFLPEGSYEANLEILKNGIVSNDISLYCYAYRIEDDGSRSYVNSHNQALAISLEDSIAAMRNLAEVDELDDRTYNWIKNYLMNGNSIKGYYYLTSGNVDGYEVYGAYLDIMAIAFNRDDRDLYGIAASYIAMRVATYNNSPALSMVYRTSGDRYVFYARENLGLVLALM